MDDEEALILVLLILIFRRTGGATASASPLGRALDEHLLINVTADRVIRLLPPLIIEEAEIDTIVDTLRRVISDWNAGS